MTPVHRYEQTTLCLTEAYLPYMVCTAEKAFMHLLKDTAVGLAADGSRITFECMRTGRVPVTPDQPVLRSSHHTWVLPTIMIARKKAFYDNRRRKREDGLPPIREVFDYFKGFCQFCGKKVKWKDASANKRASREHLMAVSRGGPDHRGNILLMHADCNQYLGNAEVKHDIDGNVLSEGMRPSPVHFVLPPHLTPRPEWVATCPWLAARPIEVDLTS